MIKDPICGMELKEGEGRLKLEFKGKEYYFCSNSCKDIFEKLNGLKKPEEGASIDENVERKMVAYNILKQLSATVAHYIRNANSAISAQSQLLSRESGPEIVQKSVPIIIKESGKIEAIVSALLSISEMRLQKYIESEEEAIFDLRNSIDEILKGN